MKLDIATPICKVCFQPITEETFASFLHNDPPVCPRCFRHFNPRIENVKLSNGVSGITCYEYNEDIKTLLFNFKACFDYELKDVFFYYQAGYFKRKYRKFTLVPAPSFKTKDEERGFNHVVAMFSSFGLPIVKAIEKTSDVKQADLTRDERQEVGRYLNWVSRTDVRGKNVLFVDDVLTTGSTAVACTNLIKSNGAKRVEFLIMSHTKNHDVLNQKAPLKR